jgi:hypothetical protein
VEKNAPILGKTAANQGRGRFLEVNYKAVSYQHCG